MQLPLHLALLVIFAATIGCDWSGSRTVAAEVHARGHSDGAVEGGSGGPAPPQICLSFSAYFSEGFREDLAASVDVSRSDGGSVSVPGVLDVSKGFGVDVVMLRTALFLGYPWNGPLEDPATALRGLSFGGLERDSRTPAVHTTQAYGVAKSLFDAMTRATETASADGGTVRTSPKGLIRCEHRVRAQADSMNDRSATCYLRGMLGATAAVTECP